ncbi:MAG: hypothetical protein E7012_06290 [Alphaproteobacteria bacterium]|nr:hypothetical protein [Alphaproteobacteria bacterium]
MNYRYSAVIATIANSFSDALLDYSVNKYNYYKVLLYTSIVAFLLQYLFGALTDIEWTPESVPYLFIHAILVLLGYVCFVKSLEYLPLGLVGLIESSNLFITLSVDSVIGYIKITPYFMLMFSIFISSIVIFSKDCLLKKQSCIKHFKLIGFVWVFASVIFYVSAPYLVKISDNLGANEIAINLVYYLLAIPYFAYLYYFKKPQTKFIEINKYWWNNVFFLCLIIGLLESIYFILETFSFINDAPTIVMIISQLRIFLIFGLSVLFKMDTFSIRKGFAVILGVLSIIGVYFN